LVVANNANEEKRMRNDTSLHPSSFILEKKPGIAGLSVSGNSCSGAYPYQSPGAFDRAGTVRPLDVSLVTHYGLDHPVGAFEQTERTQKIHPRTHGDLRTARTEQAAEG
jgi:hypothetical protein